MRFINVTDETYEKLVKISDNTGESMPEIIDFIIEGFHHLAELSIAQDLAIKLADSIISDLKEGKE